MIQFPDIKKPNSGIFKNRGTYYVTYFQDGARVTKSLRTAKVAEARKARDQFYADLAAKGATVHKNPRENRYIYIQVRVPGHKPQCAKSLEEALRIRDELLKI